jgi:hypothetical protein
VPELDPYQPAPMNWCERCGVHAAHGPRCPVCLDKERLSVAALARMASTCRG